MEGSGGSKFNCLFCDNIVQFEIPRDGSKNDASKVQTDDFVKSISKCCEQRCDEWSYNVKGEIEFFSSDLHAADAVYHRPCCVIFRTGRQIPVQYIDGKKQKGGRPENATQQKCFPQNMRFF